MNREPDLERVVGGLRCRDVLALLPDYVDGELDPAAVDNVNAHLTECDHCERFGGRYASLVATLRGALLAEGELDESLMDRLHQRLERLWGEERGDPAHAGD